MLSSLLVSEKSRDCDILKSCFVSNPSLNPAYPERQMPEHIKKTSSQSGRRSVFAAEKSECIARMEL